MAEYKNLFGLTGLPMAILAGITLACVSRRARDLFFFLLVTFTIMTHRLDVNFVSREWYRGTTRGFEISMMDILAISILFSSLLRPAPGQARWYWPASVGFILLFFFYACGSVATEDPMLFGLFELSKMLRGIIVFLAAALFVRSERELRILVTALAVVVCWQGCVVFVQRYHQGMHRVEGTIGNPNSLSMYLCLITPIFVAAVTSEFPKYVKRLCALAILAAGLAMILTISRAGLATMALVLLGVTVACVSFKLTARKVLISLGVMLIASAVLFKAWHTLEARYTESTLADEYKGKGQGRGYYLRIASAIAQDRWFGVGLNNWSYWVSNEYGPRLGWHFVPYIGTDNYPSDVVPPGRNIDAAQAAPAHNLGALVLGELGIPGLVLFALLWLRWFQMGMSFLWQRSTDPTLRLGAGIFFCTWGIFLQSLTEWVYRLTPIFFTFNILLGTLASLYYMKRQRKRAEAEAADAGEELAADESGALSWEES